MKHNIICLQGYSSYVMLKRLMYLTESITAKLHVIHVLTGMDSPQRLAFLLKVNSIFKDIEIKFIHRKTENKTLKQDFWNTINNIETYRQSIWGLNPYIPICSYLFKIKPIMEYAESLKGDVKVYIGFIRSEAERAKILAKAFNNIYWEFPVRDLNYYNILRICMEDKVFGYFETPESILCNGFCIKQSPRHVKMMGYDKYITNPNSLLGKGLKILEKIPEPEEKPKLFLQQKCIVTHRHKNVDIF